MRTKRAVAALKAAGAKALFHCGDITIAEVVYECCDIPGYFVFGNCDFDREGLRRAITAIGGTCLERGDIVTLAGRRIAITHGDSEQELRRLAGSQPDYLAVGPHPSDERLSKWTDQAHQPGALHRASIWTVALLDLASNRLESVANFQR